jgi:hypothetical protein
MAIDVTTAIAAITTSSTSQPTGVLADGQWQVTAAAACWVAVGTTPVAVVGGAGCVYIPANYPVLINVPKYATGGKIAVIQDTAAGKVSFAQNV